MSRVRVQVEFWSRQFPQGSFLSHRTWPPSLVGRRKKQTKDAIEVVELNKIIPFGNGTSRTGVELEYHVLTSTCIYKRGLHTTRRPDMANSVSPKDRHKNQSRISTENGWFLRRLCASGYGMRI
jgi:hypothetical protein